VKVICLWNGNLENGAGEAIRTPDPNLGNAIYYACSYLLLSAIGSYSLDFRDFLDHSVSGASTDFCISCPPTAPLSV
jgi:hypothetical protein